MFSAHMTCKSPISSPLNLDAYLVVLLLPLQGGYSQNVLCFHSESALTLNCICLSPLLARIKHRVSCSFPKHKAQAFPVHRYQVLARILLEMPGELDQRPWMPLEVIENILLEQHSITRAHSPETKQLR